MVVYLLYGDLRTPWACRLWQGKGRKALLLPGPGPPGFPTPLASAGLPYPGDGRRRVWGQAVQVMLREVSKTPPAPC